MLEKVLGAIDHMVNGKARKEFERGFAQDIDKTKNYILWKKDGVFTGQQVLNLMWYTQGNKIHLLMIVMDAKETDLPATAPDTELGPAEEQ